MEEKDKLKLLKRELKERLPYGVKVQIIDDNDCVMVGKLDKETLNFVGKWEIVPLFKQYVIEENCSVEENSVE